MQMTLNEIKKSYPELPIHPQNTFSCVAPDEERKESLKISLLREGVIQKIILMPESGQLMIWDGNIRYNLLRELHMNNLLPQDFDPNIVIWHFTPDNLDLLAAELHIHCKYLSPSQRAAYAAKHLLCQRRFESAHLWRLNFVGLRR